MTQSKPYMGSEGGEDLPEPTPDMSAQERHRQIQSLLERVEAATGADRELDCLLWCVASPAFVVFEAKHDGWMVRDPAKPGSARKVLPYTASLDEIRKTFDEQVANWTNVTRALNLHPE